MIEDRCYWWRDIETGERICLVRHDHGRSRSRATLRALAYLAGGLGLAIGSWAALALLFIAGGEA